MLGLRLLSEFFGKSGELARRKLIRPTQRAIAKVRGLPIPTGFFDQYPRFYSTSDTAAVPNRLNQRWRACIEANEAIIRGSRVLDLASHDGRWSFAALKAGAAHTMGIEARPYLVTSAVSNMRTYGIPEQSFQFIAGDVFEELDRLQPGSIDAVLCLGFFYHVANHMLLLSKIDRLGAKYIILDTALYIDPYPVVALYAEEPEGEANAARIGSDRIGSSFHQLVMCGAPSKSGLELMLSNFGWSWTYYDWHHAGIGRWDDIVDYHENWRVTMRIDLRK